MSTNIKEIRFYPGRKHIIHRSKTPRKGLSSSEIYNRKENSRIQREMQLAKDERLRNYIMWIKEIQNKLGISNEAFARRIGIKYQMLMLWYRMSGHFPSQRSYRRLLELERETKIVSNVRVKFGIKCGSK